MSQGFAIVAVASALLFILILLGVAIVSWWKEKPIGPAPMTMFRIVLALAGAAFAGACISGFMDLKYEALGITIEAGGALAVFVVLFYFNPAIRISESLDPHADDFVLALQNGPPLRAREAWGTSIEGASYLHFSQAIKPSTVLTKARISVRVNGPDGAPVPLIGMVVSGARSHEYGRRKSRDNSGESILEVTHVDAPASLTVVADGTVSRAEVAVATPKKELSEVWQSHEV